MVAGQPVDRLHERPGRRQEPDFRDPSRRRRSGAVDEERDGRQRLRVVGRRRAHRLSRRGCRVEGAQGPQGSHGRLRGRTRRVRLHPYLDVRRRRGLEGAGHGHATHEGQHVQCRLAGLGPRRNEAGIPRDEERRPCAGAHSRRLHAGPGHRHCGGAGDPGRPRYEPALVARRIEDRVRVGDEPPGLLSCQRTHRRRGRVRRHAGIGHRRVRRRPEPDRLDQRGDPVFRACTRPPAICSSPIPPRRPSRASASPMRSSDLASLSRRTARRSHSAPRRRRRWRRSMRPAAPAFHRGSSPT